MAFISLILTIALAGLLVSMVVTLVPMPETFKRAIYIVSTVLLIIYVANYFGLVSELPVHLRK